MDTTAIKPHKLNLSNSVYLSLEMYRASHVDRVETEQDETSEQEGGGHIVNIDSS